jgi:hypothetical protein
VKDTERCFGNGLVIGWLLGLAFLSSLNGCYGHHTDSELIEKGFGHYDPQTGEFVLKAKAEGEK